ncbi:MAG: Structural maintenance of chromosomes protein 1 [Alectoria fallacina]|uniref:Structural maintenance of chromosomes protein n=1 Tax=Alectoria fallacina TaxID=1903189 RepID=A0A8H3G070_9LECA|nr:MAG: Structural maintenance of chromosomes protein 1 [Alectoria fallacina]
MGKLIRLELYNFKSYKGHHLLLLGDSYFTSIIGPNGSGKSNSMDAISFVLGIKSSHLRSAHLRDLVFRGRVLRTSKINGDGSATSNGVNSLTNGDAGSDEEKSRNGAQERNDPKSAWVMAVYEDDAGDVQLWKRTITSQGVSEYRINDRVVPAQQYNEALESENILIKARNFLVFQGDVEAIASQSPRDLTRLIEQISGSLEYKAEYERLKEAQEEALENQNFTLHRRRGINSEIKQYTDQKNEADNYNKKADERDQSIVTHILWKLYHFQRVIEESGVEIQKHQEELKEQRRGIEKYDRAFEEAKKEQAKVGRDVSKIEKTIKQKEKDVEAKENGLVPIAEKIAITNRGLTSKSSRIAELSKEHDIHTNNVEQSTKDLKVVEKAQAQWESDFRKLAEQEGRELSTADLQRYSKLKEEVNKSTSADQIKVDSLGRQQKADEETVKSLKSKVDTVDWQAQKLGEELAEIGQRKDRVNSQIKQTTKEISGKKKTFNEHTSERLRLAQLRTEKDEKLQEVLTKLLEAEDGRKQNEKDLRLKATIVDMKRIFPGVKGRVSELCKPVEKRYQMAVSTVFGRNFDAVIVENEKTAIECIQYLREQRRGQATFIPLDTIQFTALNSNLKGQHRGCRMALDTINYERSLERAVSYVCGNAVICDDLVIAKTICWEKRNDVKAVTLDGSIIHKGGNMTGGQGGKQDSRRWEDTEVENLRKLQEKLISELAALPESRRGASDEEVLQGELTGLEQKLTYLKDEAKAHERNQTSKQKELAHARQELGSSKPKYEAKLRELQDLESTLKEFQDAVSEIQDEIFADFCQRLGYTNIRTYEAQQGSLQQEGAQKKLEFSTQKSRLESRISYEQQQLHETKSRVKVAQDRATQDEVLVNELEAEKESSQNELDGLMVELDQLTEQLEQQKVNYNQKAEKVAEQRREVQKRSKNFEGTFKAISGLEADRQLNASSRYTLLRRCKLEDISIPLEEESRGLDQLPLDVFQTDPDAMDMDDDQETITLPEIQNYGIEIDFDDLDEDLRESNNERLDSELRDRVKILNSELESMAPNMRAVERLGVVQDRLKTTDRDFEDARKRAKRAKDDFQTVKEQRFELFSKAFSHISEQIGPIYKDLTRDASLPMGGQAYLDMEDGDEPYLDGIKYHAMPPLKRFRDMEHLSGGEKTMAALALLFAVHSYQPSPFFVLDEVDAALDNANVAKIANYIRDHAGPGMQFIVISLKTGLFQGSETLVGIYRDQGANSSKALTLDLRRYQ